MHSKNRKKGLVTQMTKFKVITLCGSTKFKKEYEMAQKELTLDGYIVISVSCFGHSDDTDKSRIMSKKTMLDEIHLVKIDMADEIFVIDVDNYIGKSTSSEIAYAKETGKVIRYYSDWIKQRADGDN